MASSIKPFNQNPVEPSGKSLASKAAAWRQRGRLQVLSRGSAAGSHALLESRGLRAQGLGSIFQKFFESAELW